MKRVRNRPAGRPKCGRPGRMCRVCRHHARLHAKDGAGVRGACAECGPGKCPKFAAKPCGRPALRGRVACRLHGGRARRGVDHPGFKGAPAAGSALSLDVPTGLVDHVAAALADPQLVGLRSTLAFVTGRILQLRANLGDRHGAAYVLEVDRAFATFKRELQAGRGGAALAALETTITTGAADRATWSELLELIEQQRRLVDSEARRERDVSGSLSQREAMAMATYLHTAVRTHVSDPDTLRRIRDTFARLMHAGDLRGLDAGGTGTGHGRGDREPDPV